MGEMMSFEVLPAMGIKPELVVLASAACATVSLGINLFGGVVTEKKRAELQLELERGKLSLAQLAEIRGVTARYRGPLLESAIDLEQRLWHLITEWPVQWRSTEDCAEEFLGFVEVVRREGPREQAFLQAGNPQGSDTLSTLVEGVRFVLCASQSGLEKWYLEGQGRPHPGSRSRQSRDEIIREHSASREGPMHSSGWDPGTDTMHVTRGAQRAIGSFMITTPMGARRHYTQSYGDFYNRWDSDSSFRRWFDKLEADALDLATGAPWHGQGPFPVGRWTRVLLLQQLLVDCCDLLDPDCVRLPLSRRTRLMPDLSQAWDTGQARESGGGAGAALEGIRGMLSGSFDSEDSSSSGGGGSYSNGSGVGAAQQQQQQQQQARR
ncbi:expressed protein [Chlorella variabilis]|uniref:Expressed protein n=1 Tax=Chlorella variabilis TaxID=554065 RepID=E1ZM50_CHLVA|nr:expressed protein [Chlorella variabilis]EFN53050.1 expressed protein [Chlorella variabilis]|eukprot:XP_005845152.1 expressed protein [Chlorella variabilis]